MKAYNAPLDDIRFVLWHLVDLDSLKNLPESDVLADQGLTDTILEQASRFATEVLWPLDSSGDRQGSRWNEKGVTTAPGFVAAYRQFVEAGWNNIEMPGEYGGQDLPQVLCCAVQEMFVAANKAFCMCPHIAPAAVRALVAAGSEPLKSFFIPKLVSGEYAATMDLTEPQAGSDVGALRTRAESQPDGSYRLFGQKIFITFGDHDLTENIMHLVLARITGAPAGSKGISLFVVPKILQDGRRNDVLCTGIEHKLGNHASPTCSLTYGARGDGAVGWLVGQENRGLQSMFVMMNGARFNVGLEAMAVADRAYQQALAYARERVQGRLVGGKVPVAIVEHPDVRRMLLSMRSQIEAMRAVGYQIAAARHIADRHLDAKERQAQQAFVDLVMPVFKGWATETSIEVASTCIQVHGGAGYLDDHGATQPLRDVRITSIYEGTTSIQAHDLVERKLVRDGGAAYRAWLPKAELTVTQLVDSGSPELSDIGRGLQRAIEALTTAVEHAIARFPNLPSEVLAGSVPLLRAFGIVLGGWQMGRAALVAQRCLQQGQGHAPFLKAKLVSARFYSFHVTPLAVSLATTAVAGGASVMAMEESAF